MTRTVSLLKHHKYLNNETCHKNEVGSRAPVWVVQDGQVIYIRMGANSGMVKRMHNNPLVNIASCEMDGNPVGEWIPVQAREVNVPAIGRRVDQLLYIK